MQMYNINQHCKVNRYGNHENYLVARAIPFERIARALVPFLVTRQIYAGAGKVGTENQTSPAVYQISQRADFFETLMDLNTMVKRPIINTRDEPHADPAKYRRLHVIAGGVNMTEVATFLKGGAMAVVLDMVEDNWPLPAVEVEGPALAVKRVFRGLAVKGGLELAGGRAAPAHAG